ncbi:hypothetical protein SLA2020_023670 [Shorea laevis]
MAESNVRELAAVLGEKLSLTTDEDVGLDLDEGTPATQTGGESKWCLLGTLLIKKRYNMEALEKTLASVWRPVKGMHMRVLGDNFFAFYFFHPVDMQRVMAEGPWHFANHTMILGEAGGGRRVAKDDLFEVPFWIQIHDLPPTRLTVATGRRIGAEIGRLIDVDAGDNDAWGSDFIRVHVGIDARKPLRRGMRLSLKEGPLWVHFQYEHLQNFCYSCGMLDHVDRDCELGLELEMMGKVQRPYGDELRAVPWRKQLAYSANFNRWLRDGSGNPVAEGSRRRGGRPSMESIQVREQRESRNEGNRLDWRDSMRTMETNPVEEEQWRFSSRICYEGAKSNDTPQLLPAQKESECRTEVTPNTERDERAKFELLLGNLNEKDSERECIQGFPNTSTGHVATSGGDYVQAHS